MFVYVITASEFCQKIGISRDPEGRLATLRTGHYQDLKLTLKAETPNAAWAEALVHKALRQWRIRGEWFAVSMNQAVETVRAVVNQSLGWDCQPFTEGETVLCITEPTDGWGESWPELGEVYTVSKIYADGEGIDLAEIQDDQWAWHPSWFRRLLPREKADLSRFFP